MKTQLINAALEKVDMKNINSEKRNKKQSHRKRKDDLKKLKNAITSQLTLLRKTYTKVSCLKPDFMATEET